MSRAVLGIVRGPAGGMVVDPMSREELVDLLEAIAYREQWADRFGAEAEAKRMRQLLLKLRPLLEGTP